MDTQTSRPTLACSCLLHRADFDGGLQALDGVVALRGRVLVTEEAREVEVGDGGRQPGQFYAVHSVATNSKGDLFTTETYRGQRVQKFVFRGLAAVTKKDQGVVWPRR